MEKKPEIEKIYSLSPMQEGMLFSSLQSQASRAYFEQISFSMEGEIEIELFEKSLNLLIERYEILRTVFLYRKIKNPRQVVLKKRPVSLIFRDISHLTPEERKSFLEEIKRKDRENGFDLSKDSLMRMAALRTGIASFEIIWSFHHIIMDGWCFGILLQELFLIYGSLKTDQPLNLSEVRPYSDYIKWLEKQDQKEASLYWNKYLADYDQQASIPRIGAPAGDQEYCNQELCFQLDEYLTGSLISIAKKNQVTLNIIIQSIWGILLQHYNNMNDVVFGAVVSGRPPELTEVEKMVGLFVNTIPVRIKSNSQKTFSQLLAEVQEAAFFSDKYKYLSLAKIQSNTKLKQGLIDHLIVLENYPLEDSIKNFISGQGVFGFSIRNIEIFEHTNYDFDVIVMPGKELIVRLIYNTLLFDPNFILKIGVHFQEIAKKIIDNNNLKVAEIEILTEIEKRQILYGFNDTGTDYPKSKTIHQLFEEQVKKTPSLIAVVFQDRKLTYRELNQKANQLARFLRNQGIGPESITGIMLERSPEFIIGILGVLKAGGAYLPIDPEYPEQRIVAMLNDSGVPLLITNKRILEFKRFSQIVLPCRVILADQIPEIPRQESEENLPDQAKPENLVYVIYTSGSTGQPKGVMLEHRNLINLISYEFAKNGIDFGSKVLQFATICFDVSFQEIFSTLLSGGELHLIDQELKKEIRQLFDYINDQKIKIIFLPTALLKIISNEGPYLQKFPKTIEQIIVAGEQLIVTGQFQRWLQENKVTLHNHYGPSETHVVTNLTIRSEEAISEIPPIGKPISNTQVYILDQNLMLQPVGVAGELYIAGDNLGRGYLNRPDLTAEKFIPNPFNSVQCTVYSGQFKDHYKNNCQLSTLNSQLYKTGDLARWLPDGQIEYLGRIDHQVKIRGFRVEPGEIEYQLLKYEAITEAVVIAHTAKNGAPYLCAYIVVSKELTLTELRDRLLQELPEYMVPSFFIPMERLPFTSNGKINRHALPEPMEKSRGRIDQEPPRNEIEKKLIDIWQEKLGIDKISIDDNFFELGGHSLSIIRIMADIFILNWGLTIQDFYKYPTIRQLSDKIKGVIENQPIAALERTEDITEPIWSAAPEFVLKSNKNDLRNILLTGATGFLGMHLLNELMLCTEAKIYCLIRGENPVVTRNKLLKLINFYFPDKYEHLVDQRIFVVHGDITRSNLGLTESDYEDLGSRVDTIIHTAGLVKHYGAYEDFQRANVLGTVEVIEFAVRFHLKLSHISTTGISGDGLPQSRKNLRFTERDFYLGQNYTDNVYIRSKFEAENLVLKAMNSGLEATIFRVGNLTGRYSDGHFQININENAFYNRIKALIKLGVISREISERSGEFTPVDQCSSAIVKLLRTNEAGGRVFHVFNHKLLKISEMLVFFKSLGIEIKVLDNNSFIQYINGISQDKKRQNALLGIVTDFDSNMEFQFKTSVRVTSEITCEYLQHLEFNWPEIDLGYLKKMIRYMEKVGYLSV